jgi:hypothetical protein
MDQILERWLPIAGYEGLYEVSDHGRVRSLDRKLPYADGRVCIWKGRILRQSFSAGVYPKVALSKNCRQATRTVHRLVLETFVGPCPDGMEGCHNDGDPTNNHLSNLRWDTPLSNSDDKIRHGTTAKGSQSGPAVLTEESVLSIRARYRRDPNNGRSNSLSLANEFGVTRATIVTVVARRTWKHI